MDHFLAYYFLTSCIIMLALAIDTNDEALQKVVNGPFGQQVFFVVLVVFFGPIALARVTLAKFFGLFSKTK